MKKKDAIKPASIKSDEYYMRRALFHARRAGEKGEVPIGAVVVYNGRIIAWGENSRESGKNALGHAEISAIDRACRRMGGWRLCDCTLYVTVEPCPMCAGAIINARLPRVVVGTYDSRFGCFGGNVDFNAMDFNHRPKVEFGVCREEAASLMSDFFSALRKKHLRSQKL